MLLRSELLRTRWCIVKVKVVIVLRSGLLKDRVVLLRLGLLRTGWCVVKVRVVKVKVVCC